MTTFQQVLQTLQQPVLGNSLQQWLIAALTSFMLVAVFLGLRRAIAARFLAISERRGYTWAQAAAVLTQQTRALFLLVVALYCGSLLLELPAKPTQIVNSVVIVTLLFQFGFWGNAFLSFGISNYKHRRILEDAASVTTVTALGFFGKVVLWTFVVLLSLDNVGVHVTALIAGLGIGGIAVALAAQNVLGDLLASLSIVLDKPFVLGDYIVIGEHQGTVERIGLKTTRVKSLTGEQLIFSNNELLKATIRNQKRMTDRRVVFRIDVTYQTPHAKLASIPGILREAIDAQQPVRFDRAHFKEIGPSSLVFEIVYFVLTPDYNQYMDIQQAINLAMIERFEREQIQFAHPTQTIFLQPGDPKNAANHERNQTHK